MRSTVRPVVFAVTLVLGLGCTGDDAPWLARAPEGPGLVKLTETQTYTITPEDRQGDLVSVQFCWDDGSTSPWSAFAEPGTPVAAAHSWSDPGDYQVYAQAKDEHGNLSEPSPRLAVAVEQPDHIWRLTGALTHSVLRDVWKLAASLDGQLLYLLDRDAQAVGVVSTADNSESGTIQKRGIRWWDCPDMAIHPNGEEAFVTAWGEPNYVGVITVPGHAAVDSFELPGAATGAVAVSPDGQWLYVQSYYEPDDHTIVYCVRASDYGIVDTIYDRQREWGDLEMYLSVAPGGECLIAFADDIGWIVNLHDNTLSRHPRTTSGNGVAFAPDGHTYFYGGSASDDSDAVYRIDTESHAVLDSVVLPEFVGQMAASPDGKYLYVLGSDHVESGNSYVTVVDIARMAVLWTIPIPKRPWDIRLLPSGDKLYVTDRQELYVLER